MGSNLVEAAGFRGGFHEANFFMVGVEPGAEGFEFGKGRVSAWNHGLADIDFAGLVFAESIQGGVDDSRFRRLSMNDGKVRLLNFSALLHLAKQRGVLLAASDQKKAGGFAVEAADERKEFAGELFPEPINQGEGAIGAGGVDEPSGRLIDDQEPGIGAEDGGGGHVDGVNILMDWPGKMETKRGESETSPRSRSQCRTNRTWLKAGRGGSMTLPQFPFWTSSDTNIP